MDTNKNCSVCNIKLNKKRYKKDRTICKDRYNKKKRKKNLIQNEITSSHQQAKIGHDINNYNNRTILMVLIFRVKHICC